MGGRFSACWKRWNVEFLNQLYQIKTALEVAMQNQFVGIHVESNLSNQRFLLTKSSLKFNVIK